MGFCRGGYALFEGSKLLADSSANPDRFESTGTLQWGGGLDVRTPVNLLTSLTLRFEVRGYYSLGDPNLNVGHAGNQHSLSVRGGLVLRRKAEQAHLFSDGFECLARGLISSR